jgi:hypothetical protein
MSRRAHPELTMNRIGDIPQIQCSHDDSFDSTVGNDSIVVKRHRRRDRPGAAVRRGEEALSRIAGRTFGLSRAAFYAELPSG